VHLPLRLRQFLPTQTWGAAALRNKPKGIHKCHLP